MAAPVRRRRPRRVIGWREWVSLPELDVPRVKAKVDTGARTSAIHAWDVEVGEHEGIAVVRFVLHPDQDDDHVAIPAQAPLAGWRDVRSSNGEVERRPAIITPVELGTLRWDIELTLARRDEMGFRMLLGRRALKRRFLVDPARSYLDGTDRVPPR